MTECKRSETPSNSYNEIIENTSTYCYCIKFKDDSLEFVYASEFYVQNGKVIFENSISEVVFAAHWENITYIKKLVDRLNPEELLGQ